MQQNDVAHNQERTSLLTILSSYTISHLRTWLSKRALFSISFLLCYRAPHDCPSWHADIDSIGKSHIHSVGDWKRAHSTASHWKWVGLREARQCMDEKLMSICIDSPLCVHETADGRVSMREGLSVLYPQKILKKQVILKAGHHSVESVLI